MLVLKHSEFDLQLRKQAYAFQRHRMIDQLDFEREFKTQKTCFYCKK